MLCGTATAAGQVLNVEISSKTSAQVVLSYFVPDTTPCQIQVSENSNFQPLVHDVDPSLFAGADSDQRPGSLGGQGQRTFVVGKRIADTASDGLIYSRALQANTNHFYKVTCGTAETSGTFTVANIPFGVTYLDLPPVAIPTINDKDPVYDTQTGAFVKVAAPNSNHHRNGLAFLYWGGFARVCSSQITGPDSGYMCSFPAGGGDAAVAYYYVPGTDEMRYLGSYYVSARDGSDGWDGTVLAYAGAGPIIYQSIVDRKGRKRFLKGTYTGFYTAAQPATWIPMDWAEVDLGPSGPLGLLKELNPKIDAPSCDPVGVSGKYLFVDCRSGYQDSYPYAIGIVDMDQRKAIAARPMMTETVTRFCGEHNFHFVAPGVPALDLGFHGLTGDGSKGLGPYIVTLALDVDASTTTFHVSGEPKARADDLAMIAQEGDHFVLDGEYVQIVKKISPTEWQVSRGWGHLKARLHRAGERMWADCGVVLSGGGWAMTYWRFLDDPLGENLIVNPGWPTGGHDDAGPDLHLTEGYSFITGPLLENLGKAPSRTLSIVPGFAGVHSPAYGTTTAMHPSYHQVNDPRWFTDSKPMNGSNILSGTHLKVSGQLYKYTFGGFYANNGLHRRILPTLAFSGGAQLIDVSGPRSIIADDESMAGTYCVALVGGECRPESAAGDVYGNITNLKYLFCGGGDGPNPNLSDFCVVDNPPQGQVVLQAGLEPNRVALAPGEPDSVTGAGWTRALSRGFGNVRLIGELAKPTPDGKWLFFNARDKLLMLKMPPFEKQDELDRSTFLPFTVTVPSGPEGTTAAIQFGYAEYGPADQYYCTSRQEACVAVAQGIDVAAPFKFRDTESYSGVPCTESCQITIPVVPQHIAYYQVVYLASDGRVASYGVSGVASENMAAPLLASGP